MHTAYDKLAAQLSKLFELQKADLDFGIHRIIKARQKHIRIFLGLDEPPADDPGAPTLKKIVQREMGELNTVELERQLEATAEKIRTDYGKLAFSDTMLVDGPAKDSPDGQLWLQLKDELDNGEQQANAQLEAEIYSHLTEFFSRYYDEADFLSKRRIKAGDAPYAVPYSGEEVMLHWANKDQYYIKSSKDLKDYTFTLPEKFDGKRVQFKCERQDPVLNNNNAKREFHLDVDDEGNPKIATTSDADGKDALVIGFHFKIVDKTRAQKETDDWVKDLIELMPSAEWKAALSHVPAGAKTSLLTRHLNNYTRKNETDFFIHKRLGHFLRGELDFYIKNEVMHLDDIDEKSTDYLTTRVRLIKALRTIAHHIIRFLAQLENFQKKLWLKKKYVTETEYCFTLDRVFDLRRPGAALIETLLSHVDDRVRRYDGEKRSQHEEWIKLYRIDELEDYPEDGKLTVEFLRAHDKLMLDTAFYPPSFKWQLLGAVEDLEERLDGLLVHSENFQAMNLLQTRYRDKVKCIYIDPPYNTSENTFVYKNLYKHSTWMSAVSNSLQLAHSQLCESGVLLGAIDDTEYSNFKSILSTTFNEKNYGGSIAVEINPAGQNIRPNVPARSHDYFHIFAKNIDNISMELRGLSEEEKRQYKERDNDGRFYWDNLRRRGGNSRPKDRPKQWYPIYSDGSSLRVPVMDWNVAANVWDVKDAPRPNEEEYWPVDPKGIKRIWRYSPDGAKKKIETGDISLVDKAGRKEVSLKSREPEGRKPKTLWSAPKYSATSHGTKLLIHLFGDKADFSYPKSIHLTQDAISYWAGTSSIILDFFAGSGTTAHGAINLNREDHAGRKYILVEMGDHFDSVLKPRIQKVVYSADWIDGSPTALETGISHGFKYIRLESYEDSLNNLDLGADRSADLLGLDDQVREEFLFSYLLDVETRGHLLNLERFRDPWGCQLKIHDPHTGRGEARAVDLVETFNYLLGVTVREIRVQGTKDKPESLLTIEGENPDGESILIIWRRLEANPNVDEPHKTDWPVTDNEDLKAFAATNRGTARGLNPADTEFHAIYINGDHTLADPNSKIHCIEEVFYERMFTDTGNPDD